MLNACTPWESDEASETWWVTDNPRSWQSLTGWLCAVASARPAVPSQPCQLFRLADATISVQPSLPGPSHLRWQTAGRREIAHSRWGHFTLAGSSKHCVLVTCHLLLFSGLTTLEDRPFQFWVRHKRERVRKSWRGLSSLRLKFSERADTKRRTRLRANKSSTPTKSCCTPLRFPLTTLLLIKHPRPPRDDKKKRPYQQKHMQRKCMYKGHLQFYKMADIMLLLRNEALPYCAGEKSMAAEKKWRKIMLAWFTTNR